MDRHWRDAEGVWRGQIVHGDASLPIPCLNIELPLAELYRDLPAIDE